MKKLKRLFFLLPVFFGGLLSSGCDFGETAEKTWFPESEGILSAAVSSSGRYVLLGNDAGQANLWDISQKKPTIHHAWKHQESSESGIIAVDISANEKYALTADENSLAWWKVGTPGILGYWKLKGIKSIALSRNGQYALVGFKDSAIYFSLRQSRTKFTFTHPDYIKTLALSGDGRFALTGSDNSEARLWSLKDGALLYTWKYKTKLFTVALSPDGKYAVTNAVLGETRIWRTSDGKLIKRLPPRRVTITAAAFDLSGKRLLVARANRRIDLWKVKSGKRIESWWLKKSDVWTPSSATVLDIRFVDKGRYFLSVTSDGIAQRWKSK